MRYVLIMAGGSGKRLWPLSRQDMPKQLLKVLGGKSLLRIAFERLEGVVPADRVLVCTGAGYASVVAEERTATGGRLNLSGMLAQLPVVVPAAPHGPPGTRLDLAHLVPMRTVTPGVDRSTRGSELAWSTCRTPTPRRRRRGTTSSPVVGCPPSVCAAACWVRSSWWR